MSQHNGYPELPMAMDGGPTDGHLFRSGQRQIVDVVPCPTVLQSGHGPWSCSCCGQEFDRPDSWCVRFRAQADHVLVFVVCPGCASDLAPVRVTIDVVRIAALVVADGGRGTDDEVLDALCDVVREVLQERETTARDIPLRASDVAALADALDLERSHLVERLRGAGLVADR